MHSSAVKKDSFTKTKSTRYQPATNHGSITALMNTTTISYEHALYPDDGVDEGDDGQEGSNVEQGRQGDDKAALLTFDALKYASGNCQRLPCFLLLMPLLSGGPAQHHKRHLWQNDRNLHSKLQDVESKLHKALSLKADLLCIVTHYIRNICYLSLTFRAHYILPFSKISRSLSSVEREQRSVKPGKILKISYCEGDVDDGGDNL